LLLTFLSESPHVHQRGSFASTSYQSLDLPEIICYYHSYRLPTLPNITCYYSPTPISSFSIFLAYIFLESTSLKYHCTFSLYKVTDFTIRESPCLSKGTFCRYQLSVTWLTRHHLLLLQLPVTCFTRHYLLSLTNPLDFSYQVTKYLNYGEWIRLFEQIDQLIIQYINLSPKHLGF
jgi:hypothetical protein